MAHIENFKVHARPETSSKIPPESHRDPLIFRSPCITKFNSLLLVLKVYLMVPDICYNGTGVSFHILIGVMTKYVEQNAKQSLTFYFMLTDVPLLDYTDSGHLLK